MFQLPEQKRYSAALDYFRHEQQLRTKRVVSQNQLGYSHELVYHKNARPQFRLPTSKSMDQICGACEALIELVVDGGLNNESQ